MKLTDDELIIKELREDLRISEGRADKLAEGNNTLTLTVQKYIKAYGEALEQIDKVKLSIKEGVLEELDEAEHLDEAKAYVNQYFKSF